MPSLQTHCLSPLSVGRIRGFARRDSARYRVISTKTCTTLEEDKVFERPSAVQRDLSRFSEEQIIGILKERETSVSVAALCRNYGVSDASIYKWKAKFGGLADCRISG